MEKVKTTYIELIDKDISEDDLTIKAYVSTNTVDRDMEVINQYKIDDVNYEKNPIVLFQHNRNMPIGKSLWRKPDERGYLASTKFSKKGTGAEIFDLYKEKILNAFSIGFKPLEAGEFKDEIYYYGQIELLEYSGVSLPANPDAISLAFIKGLKSDELKQFYVNDYLLESMDGEIKRLNTVIEEIKASTAVLGDSFEARIKQQAQELVQEEIDKLMKEVNPKLKELSESVGSMKLEELKKSIYKAFYEQAEKQFK